MADSRWFDHEDHASSSNDAMVDELVRSRTLTIQECIHAFREVDRQDFWPPEGARWVYADNPIRSGKLHISAPHIYAKALESLMPLTPGMSFLNIGSGTGYFNSIVSELIGPLATSHGVELLPDTVEHARRCCRQKRRDGIEFTVGNIYELDVTFTTKYDRIYLGACANSRSKYLYRLLEVGGVLVGPFAHGHGQQLRRVVRESETEFKTEVLGSVQFALLVEPQVPPPPPPPPRTEAQAEAAAQEGGGAQDVHDAPRRRLAFTPPYRRGRGVVVPPGLVAVGPRHEQRADDCGPLGLPGVPFAFRLTERPWTTERCDLYPPPFRHVAFLAEHGRCKDPSLSFLPQEVWFTYILPFCGRHWFDRPAPAAAAAEVEAEDDMEFESPFKRARDSDSDGECRGRSDSDAASTRAPSSRRTSAQSTPLLAPDLGPLDEEEPLAMPPSLEELDRAAAVAEHEREREQARAQEREHAREPDPATPLVEIFGNGMRHAIGLGRDPDDSEAHVMVPYQLLQIMAQNTPQPRRRRRREEEDVPVSHAVDSTDEEDEEEDEQPDYDEDDDDEDVVMEQAPEEHVEALDDDGYFEVMEVEGEPGPTEEEAADMMAVA